MTDLSREGSLEQVVPEQDFARLLTEAGTGFHQLAGELLAQGRQAWTKRQFFVLYTESDELESFLDDYGARTNRTYGALTEIVASVRGFALAGLSLEHLVRRIDGYGVLESFPEEEASAALRDLGQARTYVQDVLIDLLRALQDEARGLGVTLPPAAEGAAVEGPEAVRFRLANDVGTEAIEDEEQRIAEVSSKYLQACAMLEEAGLERFDNAEDRHLFLKRRCNEESARVYEATVHNLQSAYDTFISHTLIESEDCRLPRLRGHVSATLHALEAVTQLTHFIERHESDVRHDVARKRLAELVPRAEVSHVTVNQLLYWADRMLRQGRALAEELLPSYTDLQALQVDLEVDLVLHARPASLIVSIVNHYGTPVEMEVEGEACNAGSILELMVLVGSHPEARSFAFRGDAHPLRDIALLFEHGLGERGVDTLPEELGYLRYQA